MEWIEQHLGSLALSSGFEVQDARELFDRRLHVSIDPELRSNKTYLTGFIYAVNLLSRIFPTLTFEQLPNTDLPVLPWKGTKPLRTFNRPELTLHFGTGNCSDSLVTANCHDWHVLIDTRHKPDVGEEWNPVLACLTACYAAARTCKALLGDALPGLGNFEPFSILDFAGAAVRFDWTQEVEVGSTTLAGVGAIGSAFLFALAAHRAASGKMVLVDHDALDRSNLCRYSFFTEHELNRPKVRVAKQRLDRFQMNLEVAAIENRFEKYFDESYGSDPSFKVEHLISAPDRRDTRRRFQSKLPRRLWDASTGPNQVVLHHNSYEPDLACLSCIYVETPDENANLRHVADALGVPLQRVLSGESITSDDAQVILGKYPQFANADITGKEFDSVFRQLCSASEIKAGPSNSVLAPLSFVSAMAGVYLYFEFIKSSYPDVFRRFQQYNYTYLEPLSNPNPSFGRLRRSVPGCQCQDPLLRQVFEKVWK